MNTQRYLSANKKLLDQGDITSMNLELKDKATKFQMALDEVWRLRIDILVQLVICNVILDINIHHPVDIPVHSNTLNQDSVDRDIGAIRKQNILYLHQMEPIPTAVNVS